ncbi:MAG: hypothetical protein ACOWWO_03900 [Peptococcaceae bacterium]
MLGIGKGIYIRKGREEAIHPPVMPFYDLAGVLPKERTLLFPKQETAPDLKKEMLY